MSKRSGLPGADLRSTAQTRGTPRFLMGIQLARGTQVPAPRCWSLRDLLQGRTSWLLLTCLGGFVAGIAYVVTLLRKKQNQSMGQVRAVPSLARAADRCLGC